MGLYNLYKILKDIVRTIFGKHFLKILLVAILLFIGYIIFSCEGVFAESNIVVNDTFFTDTDVNNARSLLGETLWNRDDIDILLIYNVGQAYNNGDVSRGKLVAYWNSSLVEDNIDSYRLSNSYGVGTYFNNSYYGYNIRFFNNTVNVNPNITAYIRNLYTQDISENSNQSYVAISQGTPQNTIYIKAIRIHKNILDVNGNMLIPANAVTSVNPYFVTTSQELQTFDFDYLQISGGTSPYYTEIAEGVGGSPNFSLSYNYKGITTSIDVTNYVSVNEIDNTWSINIPYTKLVENVIVRNGESFSYGFTYNPFYGNGLSVGTGTLTYNLTTEQESQINEDSLRALQAGINQGQQQTTNALTSSDYDKNDINNILSFDTGMSGLDVVTALQNLFHTVELAFVSNEPIDIVFTVPFTNSEFVIPYNYTEEHIPLSGRLMLQTTWLGLVSLWCFKRVMTIVDFVEEGDFDMIFKNGDVKKEVL